MRLDERLVKTVERYGEEDDIRVCLTAIPYIQKLK